MRNTSHNILYFLIFVIAGIFSLLIVTEEYRIVSLLFFILGTYALYYINYELFILSTLIVNQELFSLVSAASLGEKVNLQDALYLVMLLVLPVLLVKRIKVPLNSTVLVISFIVIIFIAVLTSTVQGQPLLLGLKAAKGYYLLLFYFVFISRPINVDRLTRMIVIAGILLMILNNIQYVAIGKMTIFQDSPRALFARSGRVRFLIGDLFTIYAPLMALSGYLEMKQKWYIVAYIYMIATVFIQGMTRAVIFGFILTTLFLFYMQKRIRLRLLAGFFVILIGYLAVESMLQGTLGGSMIHQTTTEYLEKSGNIGIRYKTYDYYWGELSRHLVTGRGIWNDVFTMNNPENLKSKGIHLSDIGIMGFLFHTGFIGFVWLIALLILVYRRHYLSVGLLRPHINYGVAGYFMFSIVTFATLNCLVDRRTIIYLALSLAIMTQYSRGTNQIE